MTTAVITRRTELQRDGSTADVVSPLDRTIVRGRTYVEEGGGVRGLFVRSANVERGHATHPVAWTFCSVRGTVLCLAGLGLPM